MGRPAFRRPVAPPVHHHLHDDDDEVDRDAVKGIQHGLPTELEVQAESTERESTYPLGFRWRVPLSWVHNPSSVLALYRD